MKNDDNLVFHISQDLFQPSAIEKVDGCFYMDKIEGQFDTYILKDSISYNLTLTNTGDAFLLTGTAKVKATTSCSRCLEEMEVELVCDIDSYYLIKAPEDYDENQINEFEILNEDHNLPLGDIIKATFVVDAPLKPLCSQDCKGLCPKCGINLNKKSCNCNEKIDSSSPFAVLKDLNF